MQAFTVLVQPSLIRHSLSFAEVQHLNLGHLLNAAGLCALNCNGYLCRLVHSIEHSIFHGIAR